MTKLEKVGLEKLEIRSKALLELVTTNAPKILIAARVCQILKAAYLFCPTELGKEMGRGVRNSFGFCASCDNELVDLSEILCASCRKKKV